MRRVLYYIVIQFITLSVLFGQENQVFDIDLEWTIDDFKGPSFDKAVYSSKYVGLPYYYLTIPVQNKRITKVQLVEVQSEAYRGNVAGLSNEAIIPEYDLIIERKVSKGQIRLCPIIYGNSKEVKLLNKFQLIVSFEEQSNPFSKSIIYRENSILSERTFSKISISEEGVYGLNRSILESLGLTNFEIDKIQVFGNGGGMLPERSGADRYDDLAENAVQVKDNNSNGLLDGDDQILFYSNGPDTWTWNSVLERYQYSKNLYDSNVYYFICSGYESSKKVSSENLAEFDVEYNDYHQLLAYENDEVNFLKSGREWYGDKVLIGGTFAKTFNLESKPSGESGSFHFNAVGRSLGTSGFLNININGDEIDQLLFTKVGPDYEDDYANPIIQTFDLNLNSKTLDFETNFTSGGSDAGLWLNFLEFQVPSLIDFTSNGNPFTIRRGDLEDKTSVRFNLNSLTSNWNIWNIDEIGSIASQELGNGNSHFISRMDNGDKIYAFKNENILEPEVVGAVDWQNLHNLEAQDYLIVCKEEAMSVAEDLAAWHRLNNGYEVEVVNIDQIYNEFSSGSKDPTAIRNFVKMFYDQANSPEQLPSYLLLFGDASYDYLDIKFGETNTNDIPTFHSHESLDPKYSYCTDDYFGFMDDNEGDDVEANDIAMDIAVGRITFNNLEEAQRIVDKIKHYKDFDTRGEWLTNLTFIADDEDSNTHFSQSETHTQKINSLYPEYAVNKIYLDAFQQVSGPNGSAYPAVNEAITNSMNAGTFMVNYIGHGGERGWAHEGILNVETIRSWSNFDKMPVFVTATCSFSRFDDPERVSGGEWVLLNENGGGIAMVTTVRLVFSYDNFLLNSAFSR